MVELCADAAEVRDVTGPRNGHALSGAAKMRRDLLRPLERRVKRPRPRDRHVRVGFCRTPRIVELHLLGNREIQDAVVGSPLVRRADQRALGTGAVLTIDVDNKRVVELAFGVLGNLSGARRHGSLSWTCWITRPISWSVYAV